MIIANSFLEIATMLQKRKLLSLLFIMCFCAGCSVNPITGQDELMFSGDYKQDIAIGRQFAPEVEKELKGRINDAVLQDYIDGVGKKIVQLSHNPDFDYHFTAVNDKSINALTLPGGYVFITKGMLLKLTSESQLAGILAHEIVHVVARDMANMMSKEIGMNILLIAVMSSTSSEGAQAAAVLAGQIVSLKYSREDEKTADLGGLDYMVRAGYNPNGTVETMEMLQKEDSIKPVEFFSTHPSPENRIDYLKARIQSRYANVAENAKVGQDEYNRFVLERLKNLPDEPQKP
jgi:predicted Zn-dependent protease